MQNHWPRNDQPAKGLMARLDDAAGKMNAFLLVIAIGLAALDFTCFWIIQMRNALPPIAHVGTHPADSAKAAAAARHGGAEAAAAPRGNATNGF